MCGYPTVHEHHIFYGHNRKKSEKYGMKVYLCPRHHTGDMGVHNGNKTLDLTLKMIAQRKFEEVYKEEFIEIFGKNYL